jgi:hypothetical protein
MSHQLEFEFVGDPELAKKVRVITPVSHEIKDDVELPEYYRISKHIDWLFDKLPYYLGWKWYHKYNDIKLWTRSTYQKIRYGVSDQECWCLADTIARHTLPRLKHFKKMNRYGYPPDMTPEQWENVIDEVIWAFEYIIDNEKYNPFPDIDSKNISDVFTNPSYTRKKSPDEELMWKKYLEKSRELHERKQKALIEFAKNFESFWD